MTREERDQIVQEVLEQVYKTVPEIIANMTKTAQSHTDRFLEFYNKYPEFKEHHAIVGEVVSKVEGEDPLRSYDEMLELAVPKIREIVEAKGTVSMEPARLEAGREFIEEAGKI